MTTDTDILEDTTSAATTPATGNPTGPTTPIGGFGASGTPAYTPTAAPLSPAPAAGGAPQYYAPLPKTNTLGIITLVLGILGFGVVPVITGHIALNQIKKTGEDGRGITLAGLILGYVTVAGWLAVVLFWIGAAGLAVFGAIVAG
jgi:hypothetical protein